MLEVKSPWNSEVLDKIPQDNENHLSKLLETSSTISQKKGLDFSPIEITLLSKDWVCCPIETTLASNDAVCAPIDTTLVSNEAV